MYAGIQRTPVSVVDVAKNQSLTNVFIGNVNGTKASPIILDQCEGKRQNKGAFFRRFGVAASRQRTGA